MGNIKIDLLNKLSNDKYFEEHELVRLSNDSNLNYKKKIKLMDKTLGKIALINIKLGLIEQYFKETKINKEE